MSKKLTNAFKDLRKQGYFARQNFWCCQSCGWAAIPDGESDRAVFYHNQDNDSKRKGESFCLAWSGDGNLICEILRKHGIEVEWNGDSGRRIEVINWD
jgi:hypothetical protein